MHALNNIVSTNRDNGRPRIDVNKEDIESLRVLNYSWTKIARILKISRQTLYRRLEEFGIAGRDRDPCRTLSAQDLDEIVVEIKRDHPNDGEVLMQGHLVALGIRIPRSQLRQSIHRVDYENTQLRRSRAIKRRQYTVECPNSIWHIDGHHKLIRWRFVVHGAIDGFSRTIPYIHCATNNRACSVLSVFQGGVSRFGLPDRVRSDHGGENIDVWRYMIQSHNNNLQCVVTGSSTHNERIERLWRDVHRCVGHFSDTFRALESEDVLDTLNEVDIFSLHFVFLPRINKCLYEFQESWNNHRLSSEGNMTPYQLFAEGVNCAAELSYPTTSVLSISDTPQVTLQADIHEAVQVPQVSFAPCQVLCNQLQSSVDPLQLCSDHGKQLYTKAIAVVGDHLVHGCDQCLN